MVSVATIAILDRYFHTFFSFFPFSISTISHTLAIESKNLLFAHIITEKLSPVLDLGDWELFPDPPTGIYLSISGLSTRPFLSFNSLKDTFCPFFFKGRHYWQIVLFLTRFHNKNEKFM